MIKEINMSAANLSYSYSTVGCTYYGGQPAKVDSNGLATLLTVDDTDAGNDERIMGLFFTCSAEDSAHGNDNTTLIKLGCTVEMNSGYSKHNFTDGYPYANAEAWVAGDRVFLGYDGLWHRTAQMGSSVGSVTEYGVVDVAPASSKGLIVTFRDPTI